MLKLRDGIRRSDKQFSYSLESASNQPTRWLVLCWDTFGATTSHMQLWTHKIHHNPNSREATTFPHIGGILHLFARATSKWFFVPRLPKRSPKLPRLKLPQLCKAITLCSDLRSGWGLKQSCSFCRKLSNGVSHATCTHESRVNSWHSVVRSRTTSLTPSLSFCHNLCCRCPNESCKPF
jgi:hypothetical protein